MPRKNKTWHLPDRYDIGHSLCFMIHDVLLHLLKYWEEGKFISRSISFRDDADRVSFEEAEDVFAWLEQTRSIEDRAPILTTTVFPAVLSDMLHCFYEAFESSRKAKLNITYMLLRKPLQESLFLLEAIVADPIDFAEKLSTEPLKLRALKVGGVELHAQRIQKVIDAIGEEDRLTASYIAQLRYDKSSTDSFDGVCNHAMHLFTEHKAIRTEPLNINFIFSDWESKLTQWSYLYSRLPYLMFYAHRVVERVAATIAPTHPEYLEDIDRRISAFILLWWKTIENHYIAEPLEKFVLETEKRLVGHCQRAGYRFPNDSDLQRMSLTGAFPGERVAEVKKRNLRYSLQAKLNKQIASRAK